MRSTILIAESGSGYGGTAKYLCELLTVLDRNRYDIRVLAEREGPFIAKIRSQAVPVALKPAWRFPWGLEDDAKPQAPGVKQMAYAQFLLLGPVQIIVTVPTIWIWLKRRHIALVHLNNEILSHLPLLLAARLSGAAIICHLHGWRPFTRLERWAARFINEFVCISEAGSGYYRKELGGRKVIAIPNGILLNSPPLDINTRRNRRRAALGLAPEAIVVALVGRLVPWKGHKVFLNALASARRRHPQLVGLIVGHDPSPDQAYLKELKAQVGGLGLGFWVRFASWQEDVWSIYAATDILIHASTEPEPFGLVLLEAMAARKPVIATRSGGVVDIVLHEQTGLLVEPGDSIALALAITRFIEEPQLAKACVARAHARLATHFTLERNAAQLMAVYDPLLIK